MTQWLIQCFPWDAPTPERVRQPIITARNEVGARLYFHRHLWFCSRGGGWWLVPGVSGLVMGGGVVSQHALQVSRPTPKREAYGDLRGGQQAHTQGGSWGGSGQGVWRPPVTATAAGGTHPTGMHSCFVNFLLKTAWKWKDYYRSGRIPGDPP